MIVELKRKNGSTAILTADHFFHYTGEEGKDDLVQVKGSKINVGTDTHYRTKGLESGYVYNCGRVIWRKIFS